MQCAVGLAQLVEGFTAKQEVAGSVPVVRPIFRVLKVLPLPCKWIDLGVAWMTTLKKWRFCLWN